MCPCALRSAGPRRIGRNGSQAAKPNLALPAAGGGAGVRWGGGKRAKGGGPDFRGEACGGEPGLVRQQQRKGRAHLALRDAGATGYVCAEGECARRAAGEEGPTAAGTGRQGRGGAACGGEGETPEGGGRLAVRKGRRKS